MIRTIIVDDEALARASLIEDLQMHCPEVQLIGSAESVKQAIPLITQLRPQLVFLDIQLGDGSGFDILEGVGKGFPFSVVFTTAHDRYAITAFRYSATDYLLKPIDTAELIRVVQKVATAPASQDQSLQLIMETLSKRPTALRVAIPTIEGLHVLAASDIVRCQADSNYSRIFLSSGEKLMAAKTLKELEEMLDTSDFERVHSSHLVNLNHLRKYLTKEGGILVMSDNSEVPVSKRKKAQLLEIIRGMQ